MILYFNAVQADKLTIILYCGRSVDKQSEVWPSGSVRRFYDGHDQKVDGLTPTQASLLHPWIRCFTAIISAR